MTPTRHTNTPPPPPPRTFLHFASCLFLFWLLVGAASALTITRAPYIQQLTDTTVIIRWQTDEISQSAVQYSPDLDDEIPVLRLVGNQVREHVVPLYNLLPNTTYYYSVGDRTDNMLAGGDSTFRFRTAPSPVLPAQALAPFRIWAMGDFGTSDANQRAVRDRFYSYNDGADVAAFLMLGDNAYPDGTETDMDSAIFNTYQTLLRNTPAWPALGNNEEEGPHFNAWDLPTRGEAGGLASGTENYYSFDYGSVHFVCLDSAYSDRNSGGAMWRWVEDDLAATDREFIIVYWHDPPYSKGESDSDFHRRARPMRENFVPLIDQYGVDLVLCGHTHVYERSVQIRGHYGSSTTFNNSMVINGGDGDVTSDGAYTQNDTSRGTVYVVAGTGGKLATSIPSVANWHPVMHEMRREHGSVVIDVDGFKMDVSFLNRNGQIADTFTIFHGEGNPPDVTPPPEDPSVTALPTSNITKNSALVRASLDTGMPATTANLAIFWGLSDGGTTPGNWPSSTTLFNRPDGTQSLTLSSLPSNTRTYVRFRATTSDGKSAWSSLVFFSTLVDPDVTPERDPQVTALAPINITGSSATLRALLDTGEPATTATVIAYWGTIDAGATTVGWPSFTSIANRPDGQVLIPSGGLQSGTGYVVRFRVITSDSKIAWSDAVSFTTTAEARPPEVTLLEAAATSFNTATLRVSLDTGEPADRATVTVFWGNSDAGATATGWSASSSFANRVGGTANLSISGMRNATPYLTRVRATTPDGQTAWSEPFTFTTLNGRPDIVGSIGAPANADVIDVVPADAQWRYRTARPASSWTTEAYPNAQFWPLGNGVFGYGIGGEDTVLDPGGTPGERRVSTYFRHRFFVPDPAAFNELTCELVRDDAAVVWLNGTEIHRSNLRAGTIPLSQRAYAEATDNGDPAIVFPVTQPLLTGWNVIGTEIRTARPDESDLRFNLRLRATPTTPQYTANHLTPNTAVVGSQLRDAGLAPTTLTLYYGRTQGSVFDSQWENKFIVQPNYTGATYAYNYFENLLPQTTYYYRYRAHNDAGWEWTAPATFQTPGSAIRIQPRGVAAFDSTGGTLRFDVQETGAENIKMYIFYGKLDGGEALDGWDRWVWLGGSYAAGSFTYELNGLQPSETIRYRFYGFNEETSGWSTLSFLTTLPE